MGFVKEVELLHALIEVRKRMQATAIHAYKVLVGYKHSICNRSDAEAFLACPPGFRKDAIPLIHPSGGLEDKTNASLQRGR